jgi:hypothetical protein
VAETASKVVPVPRTPDADIAAIAIAVKFQGGAGQTAPGGGCMVGHSNSFIVLCGCPTALFAVRELLDTSTVQYSVDRPRCQPGLCMKAHLCLHAAVQISAGRQPADRLVPEALRPLASQLLFGDPLSLWVHVRLPISRI